MLAEALGIAITDIPWDTEMGEARVSADYHQAMRKRGYIDLTTIDRDGAPSNDMIAQIAGDIYGMTVRSKKGVAFVKDPENTLGWLGLSPQKLKRSLQTMWDQQVGGNLDDWEDEARDTYDDYSGVPGPDRFKDARAAHSRQRFDIKRVKGRTGDGWKITASYTEDGIHDIVTGRAVFR